MVDRVGPGGVGGSMDSAQERQLSILETIDRNIREGNELQKVSVKGLLDSPQGGQVDRATMRQNIRIESRERARVMRQMGSSERGLGITAGAPGMGEDEGFADQDQPNFEDMTFRARITNFDESESPSFEDMTFRARIINFDESNFDIRDLEEVTLLSRVVNFREDMLNPQMDFQERLHRRQMDGDVQFYRESLLNFQEMRRLLELLPEKSSQPVISSLNENFRRFQRSFLPFIANALLQTTKGIGSILFGRAGKEKSPTQAIQEQTEFFRTGFIQEQRGFFGKILDRGVVGSLVAGVAGAAGLGEKASVEAQRARAAGEVLSTQQRLSAMLFKRVDKLDVRTRDVRDPSARFLENIQGILGEVKDSAIEFFDSASRTLPMIGVLIERVGNQLIRGDQRLFNELEDLNSPLMSPFEAELLEVTRRQEERNALQSDHLGALLKLEQDKKDKKSGGPGLLEGIFSSRAVRRAGTAVAGALLGGIQLFTKGVKAAGSLIFTGLKNTVIAGGLFFRKWITKNGLKTLIRAPFAKIAIGAAIIGAAYKYIARPIIDWLDTRFGWEIGNTIDGAFKWIGDKTRAILGWLGDNFKETMGIFWDRTKKVGKTFWSIISFIPKQIIKLNMKLGGWILDGLGSAVDWVGRSAGSVLMGVGSLVFDGLWSAVKWVGGKVGSVLGLVGNYVVDSLWSAVKWIGTKTSDVFMGLGSILWGALKSLGEWIQGKAADLPFIGRFIDSPDSGAGSNQERKTLKGLQNFIESDKTQQKNQPITENRSDPFSREEQEDSRFREMFQSAQEANRQALESARKQIQEMQETRAQQAEQNQTISKFLEAIASNSKISAEEAQNKEGQMEVSKMTIYQQMKGLGF